MGTLNEQDLSVHQRVQISLAVSGITYLQNLLDAFDASSKPSQ